MKHRYLISWLAGLITFVGIAYATNVYPPLPQPRNSSAVFLVDESTGVPYVASSGGGGAVTTTPAQRTLVTLDIKIVTTGGTAVTAISSGHRTAGGWIQNPSNATVNLCINEIGTATGTTSSGDTTCIIPGQTYNIIPAAGNVSVISSDSSHAFSGVGLN